MEYKFTGPRLQAQTRRAIDRITSLALMYRLSGRDPWLRRCMLEMNAVAAFRDWNPGRLIDTAEMAYACAIGYDWLYNALTPDERGTIRDAIVTKALDPCSPFTSGRAHGRAIAPTGISSAMQGSVLPPWPWREDRSGEKRRSSACSHGVCAARPADLDGGRRLARRSRQW